MARMASIMIPGGALPTVIPALTTAQTVTLSLNQIFAINGTADFYIIFNNSNSTTQNTATATTGFRIPANTTMTFDMGNSYNTISLFASSSSSVSILPLTV